jgi:predicted nucleic acid-binding Zn ribbon protein
MATRSRQGFPVSKKEGPSKVREALQKYLDKAGISEKIEAASVVPEWPALVGEGIAAVTTPLKVSNGVLFVAVRSSAWLSELKLMEREIIRRVNATRSKGRITAIRFVMS